MIRRTELLKRATRVLAVVSATVFALGVAWTGEAQAHDLGTDAVDGCMIRAEDETRYDVERLAAQAAWEALSGDDCVDIRGDTWDAVADLEWKDVNRSDVSWSGRYEWEPGADDILLNSFKMDGYDPCSRKQVAMHELGHAHRLDHSFPGQVMAPSMSPTSTVCVLQAHDIADYQSFWGPSTLPPRPPPTICPKCQEQ